MTRLCSRISWEAFGAGLPWHLGRPETRYGVPSFKGRTWKWGTCFAVKDTVMTMSTDCYGEVTRGEIWRLWPVIATRI